MKLKTSFRPIFGPKTSEQIFFQKKFPQVNFKTLYCSNFMQKKQKTSYFGHISCPFGLKLQNEIFQKNKAHFLS